MHANKVRLLAAGAVTVSALTAAIVIPVVPAAAQALSAAPCYGSSCIGRDPNVSAGGASCASGAYDVVTIGLPGYGASSVTLRYSPLCAANWARWNGGTENLTYWVETKDGRTASGTSGLAPNYTTMVDGTQLARVCIYSGFDDTENCSGWY